MIGLSLPLDSRVRERDSPRSTKPFFKNAFFNSKEVELKLKDLAKDHEVDLDALLAILAYLYSGKVRPLPKGVCVCVDDDCSHKACRPAI